MKKVFVLFWLSFFFYFVFVHPAIIYYGASFPKTNLAYSDATWALVCLGLSLFLWLVVLLVSFYLLFKYFVGAARNTNYIKKQGRRREARVISSAAAGDQAGNLLLEFDNLQNERVRHRMLLKSDEAANHTPHSGSLVALRIDESFSRFPYVALEESAPRARWTWMILWAFLPFLIAYAYFFVYNLESAGYGWRFMSLDHPLLITPLVLLFFSVIIWAIFKFIILRKLNIGKDTLILKFNGRRAVAKVLALKQTGTYINEQPEVEFEIEFPDASGRTNLTSIKKIVPLIELSGIKAGDEVVIFYDPQNKDKALFEKDIEDN